MTLREWAEQAGMNYETARTWQKRGRLERVGDGFRVVGLGSGMGSDEPVFEPKLNPIVGSGVQMLNPPVEPIEPKAEPDVNPSKGSGMLERDGILELKIQIDDLQEKVISAFEVIGSLMERVDGLEKDLKRAGFQPSKVKTVTGQVVHRIDDP